MPSAAWSWDILRENMDYHHDCVEGLKHGPEIIELESGSRLIVGKRRYAKARKWGLLFFADPDKSHWKRMCFGSRLSIQRPCACV